MTLIRSTPPSSARLAMSPSLERSSRAPPSQVKSEMCRPSFIVQPYPRRRIAQQMGGMHGRQGPSIVFLRYDCPGLGMRGIVATSSPVAGRALIWSPWLLRMTEPADGPAMCFCGGLMLEVRDPADVRSVVGEERGAAGPRFD